MTTENQCSMFFWVRVFLTPCLIAILLPIGSAYAQGEVPGPPERQQPVVSTQSAGPNSVEPLDFSNEIQDPSFEASFGSEAYWVEQNSANFGTPVCPSTAPYPSGCGNGGGTIGPHTGSAWVRFGGTTNPELGYLSQAVTFPSSCNVTLQFYLWIGSAPKGSGTDDYFALSIDGGEPTFKVNATQKASYSSYKLVSLNLQALANGQAHILNFFAYTFGQFVTFNLDDVTLSVTNCTCGAIVQSALAPSAQNATLAAGETFLAGPLGNSNGSDTTGVFRPSNGVIFLKNTNSTGFADIALNYGVPGDCPIVGDWDGNGTDTLGIYRKGIFYLRNSNTIGFADIVFAFGAPGDQPVAGDWDGDGTDTIGIYRAITGEFQLSNYNSPGPAPADMRFYLGNPGDVGVAGDWNGDGIDTTGVFRPSNGVIFLKNTNSTGFADVALNYGLPGDKPVMGDWNNDGIDTIGIYRGNTFYLRNSNTVGFAELIFALGNPGDMPIVGNWDAIP